MNNGGPAFPQTHVHPKQGDLELIPGWMGREGMTLLDYFAGQIASGLYMKAHPSDPRDAADYCYRIAECLVAEKSKREAK